MSFLYSKQMIIKTFSVFKENVEGRNITLPHKIAFVMVYCKYWTFVIVNDVGNANTNVFVYTLYMRHIQRRRV